MNTNTKCKFALVSYANVNFREITILNSKMFNVNGFTKTNYKTQRQ